jgi:hypothetical protein
MPHKRPFPLPDRRTRTFGLLWSRRARASCSGETARTASRALRTTEYESQRRMSFIYGPARTRTWDQRIMSPLL